MKKFLQRVGIFAACGLVFGGVAGGAFVGVKAGSEYVSTVISGQKDAGASKADAAKADEEATTEDTHITIGGQSVINISADADSQLYDVADLAEAVMPSIVSITSTILYQNPYAYFYGGSSTYPVTGAGSGIIIGEDDDRLLIATNNHVVEDCESLTIGFCDGSDVSATVVGTNSSNDLAVVAVQKTDLSEDTLQAITIANIGDSDSIRVGEPAMAIGNALGYGQSVTVGYISALDREVTINNSTISMIQTDAAINEGNSGGALFNLQGEVIGINSAKATNSDNNVEGMCFAIPISDALPIIQSIINGTQQTLADGNAYMGIQGKDLSAYDAASFNMPQGVYVLAAVENGPAYQAGLQSGDVITALNGTTVSSMSEIKSILAQLNPGDVITVTVARSDQGGNYAEQDITVTLGSYSE
jgi:serine protease Do